MNHVRPSHIHTTSNRRTGEQASAWTIILLLICFLGIAACVVWLYRSSMRSPASENAETGGAPAIRLSESTKAVLGRLDSPLEIRFYALLDAATVADSVKAFAGRAGQLLSAYQQEAGGKIKVTSFTPQPNPDTRAAAADGITVFNLDKGEASCLGMALVLKGRKETLPHLAAEWEQALEPDVTRAILRLLEIPQAISTAPDEVAQINTNAIREVRALIPNLSAVSVEEGKQLLRNAALKDYIAAAKEVEAQTKEAEQRLSQARNGGTEAEQQDALRHFHRVQTEQNEKLKEIAARSKAQIDTFQQLKAAPR